MTIDEASERYHIPAELLREYELGIVRRRKKVMGARRYDDRDMEHLSMVMTLYDAGFSRDEAERYMRLLLEEESTEAQRLEMLDKRRAIALDEIHFRERQLDRLDYLRHKILSADEK